MKTKRLPPLRLILTNACNGRCNFCHREGSSKNLEMPIETIEECAYAAKKLSIPSISITGGEPTLRKDLPQIIELIKITAGKTKLYLTTNGYGLQSLSFSVNRPLDCVNLSISAFDQKIASEYQNVNPYLAIKTLMQFPAKRKNINVVITRKNYKEFSQILNYCIRNDLSLDIMFELKSYTDADLKIQRHILMELEGIGHAYIELKSTPTITIKASRKCIINVKHPYLSALPQIGICNKCSLKASCFERICAIRVHPDGVVSPCLNKTILSSKNTVFEKISDIYNQIERDYSLLLFLSKNL